MIVKREDRVWIDFGHVVLFGGRDEVAIRLGKDDVFDLMRRLVEFLSAEGDELVLDFRFEQVHVTCARQGVYDKDITDVIKNAAVTTVEEEAT